ncbi:MAG TPA: DUF2281 domain-containing protein [Balneolaceae bacterium]|nr:DUF2281 domain-containing protein [Balneolaceae bacterium]
MVLREKINENVKKLPESSQAEVLDFVEFLLKKSERKTAGEESREWSNLSLSFAMRGMEEEEPIYTSDDIKEHF